MAILPDLLSLSVVTGVFSRVRAPGDVLQRYYGMGIGGKNVDTVTTRNFSYDIFNYQRGVAEGRAPGTGPSRVAPIPVGNVNVRIPRFYEKMELDYETLSQIRVIGENAGVQDKIGLRYVERQSRELKRRIQNANEFLTASVMRGGTFSIVLDGEKYLPTWTAGVGTGTYAGYTVDMQVPAANKSKLNMLGAGDILATSWDNAAAPIVSNLLEISAAFQNLVGEPLTTVVLNDKMWKHVISNTQVINLGGSANTPFAQWEMTGEVNEEGKRVGVQMAKIRGLPWVTWCIYSGVIEVWDPSASPAQYKTVKLIPDDFAVFHIEHDPMWWDAVDGGEIVKENIMAPAAMRTGHVAWAKEVDEPARVELHSLFNRTPRLTVPSAIAYGNIRY